ncbi:hypothetical protein EYC80_008621 [Monilinia laxa]|uniref:Uncharacterized protein n=1 Tax=Monilinia laxa TaxID=61186 RepID=A0A5N6K0V6_MONLA|nr:hypothetical protein EYC80_008621 [Monilinia laxa]
MNPPIVMDDVGDETIILGSRDRGESGEKIYSQSSVSAVLDVVLVSMAVSLASAKKPKLKGNTFEAVMISIAERVKPWRYLNDGIRGMTGFKCGDEEFKTSEKVAINSGVRNARSKSMR